ncbi:uncharacterized protein LOC126774350 [Nymphalis io]|uniref:uncharacterized protein LOC126774350 n=1 Tax=Inachis io TaxID=171585 RepID=UPI002168F36E|nr:uncharacterized protein LOC126774350 [Nymphalis io]
MWPKKSMYRYCVVPECKSTTIKTPEKLFFSIPTGAQRRRDWCSAMGRTRPLRPYTNYFCCEDHFDIENDMENYMKFKLYGVSKLVLKKGILPHKFACQNYMSIREIQKEQTAGSSLCIKQEADSDSGTLSCNSDTISCGSDLDNWLQEDPELQVKVKLVGEPKSETHHTEMTDPLAVENKSKGPQKDKTKPYIVSMVYVEKVKKH